MGETGEGRPTNIFEKAKNTWEGAKARVAELIQRNDGREALKEIAKGAGVTQVITPAEVPPPAETEPKEEFYLPLIENFPKDLQPELKKGLERLKEDCAKLREEIALYSDQLSEQERKEKVIAMHQTIGENYCPFILDDSTTTKYYPQTKNYFYSKEYLEEVQNMDKVLKRFCQGKAEFFSTIEVPSKWIKTEPLRPTLNFDLILDAARNVSQENQRFASNGELLTHTTGDTESTMKVLERGMLASKQYQLDNYGEYYFR